MAAIVAMEVTAWAEGAVAIETNTTVVVDHSTLVVEGSVGWAWVAKAAIAVSQVLPENYHPTSFVSDAKSKGITLRSAQRTIIQPLMSLSARAVPSMNGTKI